jgi:hypothetical protein
MNIMLGVRRRCRHTQQRQEADKNGHSRPGCSHNVIHRRDNAPASLVQYVQIDHGGTNIRVTEQFLHRTYVIAGFEQMGGKRMA